MKINKFSSDSECLLSIASSLQSIANDLAFLKLIYYHQAKDLMDQVPDDLFEQESTLEPNRFVP
jgi:hypothetical protein